MLQKQNVKTNFFKNVTAQLLLWTNILWKKNIYIHNHMFLFLIELLMSLLHAGKITLKPKHLTVKIKEDRPPLRLYSKSPAFIGVPIKDFENALK